MRTQLERIEDKLRLILEGQTLHDQNNKVVRERLNLLIDKVNRIEDWIFNEWTPPVPVVEDDVLWCGLVKRHVSRYRGCECKKEDGCYFLKKKRINMTC